MNVRSPMISRAIAIPFTPTIGCRINFNDVPLESLTPCSMLAKKLVFSPAQPSRSAPVDATPQKHNAVDDVELSVLSEESLDIIAELDCYQLELENSINEAKMNKKKRRPSAGRTKNLMDLKHRKSFALILNQPEEAATVADQTTLATQLTPKFEVTHTEKPTDVQSANVSSDVHYEEIVDDLQDDYIEFKNPAPFVRTFKRKSTRKPTIVDSESAQDPGATSKTFRSTIRSSIRRILNQHPKQSAADVHVSDEQPVSNLFSSLRQSLRRKPSTKSEPVEYNELGLSILIDGDRQVFKQETTLDQQRKPVHLFAARSAEELGEFGRKASLRNSFRNKTKDVRRQVLKSMFKTHVKEYKFGEK